MEHLLNIVRYNEPAVIALGHAEIIHRRLSVSRTPLESRKPYLQSEPSEILLPPPDREPCQ